MLHIRRRRGIGRGALPRLVRIQAALDAVHHCLRHDATEQAAANRLAAKRILKNQPQHARNLARVHNHHIQRHQQINHRHQRHNAFRHLCHAPHAAKDNRRRQQHQHRADGVFISVPNFCRHAVCRRHVRRRLHRLHNGIGLDGLVHKAKTHNQAHRKQHRQPMQVQPVRDVIRRPAAKQARFLIAHFIQLRQR